jgi:transposase
MADAATWRRRVDEWRASGLTSSAFAEGREFSAGGLRHWAYQLKTTAPTMTRPSKAPNPRIRMARVLRVAAPEALAAEPTVAVEVGAARVVVRAGFDRATLDAVLDVLSARGAR